MTRRWEAPLTSTVKGTLRCADRDRRLAALVTLACRLRGPLSPGHNANYS